MAVVGGIMVPHPPMIIPEVGRGSEKQIEKTIRAYSEAAKFVAELKPETLIVSTPHSVMYRDYFHISPGSGARGSFSRFRAGTVKIRTDYDTELVREIAALCESELFPAGTDGERDAALDHATMIPLYFLNQYLKHEKTSGTSERTIDGKCPYPIVRIGLSGYSLTDHYHLGELCAQAAERLHRRIVWIASGDLSHKLQTYGPYGFDPAGPEYDRRIMDVMGRAAFDELLDFDETFLGKAAECGHRSFVMMAGALDGLEVETEKLSHEDITGVGYGVCTYRVTGESRERHMLGKWRARRRSEQAEERAGEDVYVRLARKQVELYVREKKRLSVREIRSFVEEQTAETSAAARSGCAEENSENLKTEFSAADARNELLSCRAGTFVSIHEHGALRGCIGTIRPTADSVAEEIAQNAVSAATRDPRFPAIRPSELEDLEISVDVLGEPEKISSPDQLDVKKYGVIVTKGMRRGLLLPNLDGVDTVEQQISIAMQKAGLDTDEEHYHLERFEVVRHV